MTDIDTADHGTAPAAGVDSASAGQAEDPLAEHAARASSLTVIPVENVPEEFVRFGRDYWAVQGIDGFGKVVWAESVNKIDPPTGQPYLAAGAGVEATVPEVACTRCGTTPWRAKSRSHFDAYVTAGPRGIDGCGRCDTNFLTGVARQVDPAALARRAADRDHAARLAEARQRAQEQRAHARSLQERWDASRRRWINNRYPVTFTGAADPATVLNALDKIHAPVRTEAAALAALRYAPDTSPLPPLKDWATALAPDGDMESDLIAEWARYGLLAVHPDSDLSAFVWDQEDAGDVLTADGDPEALPEPTSTAFYLYRLSWYSRYGTSLGTAAERLDAALADRLAPDRLTADRQEALMDLVAALIAAETVRYFEFQLDLHNLPPIPENHRARLLDAAARLGAVRTLGEGYNVAWRAARDAATAAQRQPYAPKVNMTTHGVNQFESHAQRATDPTLTVPSYREDSRVPLSPLTRTVFHTILGLDPLTTSRPEASRLLPEPAPSRNVEPPAPHTAPEPVDSKSPSPEEDAEVDEPAVSGRMLQRLANPPQPYDPSAIREALEWVANGDIDPDATLRQAAQKIIEIFDAVAACTREPYTPVVAAAAAINLVPDEPAATDSNASPIYRGEILAGAIDLAASGD